MIVSAVVFIAAGLLFRTLRTPTNLAPLILLGLTLGIGYLAKTAMFPIAFIFIGVVSCRKAPVKFSCPTARRYRCVPIRKSALYRHAVSIERSVDLWRYRAFELRMVLNKVPAYVHWQGQPPGSGIPVHTTKEIFDNPRIYEFATPIQDTYAPGYDPSYTGTRALLYISTYANKYGAVCQIRQSTLRFYYRHLLFQSCCS